MSTLRFYRNEQEMMRFPLSEQTLRIGRNPDNEISLQDRSLSRLHALIEWRDGAYWVVDKSRNGVFLNQRSITCHKLGEGDELVMGPWKVLFSQIFETEERETVLEERGGGLQTYCGMVGKSDGMKQVFSLVEKVAQGILPVMILGETGTGKELVARAIHDLSPRARAPFVALNCGAISPHLIESELFGHEKGAFTGALLRHEGAFEQAHGGTLFLDEVAELPLELQPKLLRVLEGQAFRRIGGGGEIQIDVRVVAATHRDLASRVREGNFREDLFYRLYGVPLVIPPLRERKEDIPLLAEYFLRSLSPMAVRKISPQAMPLFLEHPWKGNVRELRNTIARALLLTAHSVIEPEDIHFLSFFGENFGASLKKREKETILSALREHGWNKKATAAALGIAKSTLFHKIKQYGIREL